MTQPIREPRPGQKQLSDKQELVGRNMLNALTVARYSDSCDGWRLGYTLDKDSQGQLWVSGSYWTSKLILEVFVLKQTR